MSHPDAATITIGATPLDFSCDVLSYTVTPDTGTVSTRRTMCGSKVSASKATWAAEFEVMQNWAADALAQYLIDNEGAEVPLSIESAGLGKNVTGTVLVVPHAFGGTAGEDATASFTLPFVGDPTFADPVAAAATSKAKAKADA